MAPTPNRRALATSFAAPSRSTASRANVVLQDAANAPRSVVRPSAWSSSLWMVRWAVTTDAGQSAAVPAPAPSASSAPAVTTLNVEPGG
ncbi:Uncharacterised protein [Mycobacterium tuberculosis]|nr:Uncharacterised protein [Mycobacterium tuberculosis]